VAAAVRSPFHLALIALVSAAFLLVACGSDDPSEETADSTAPSGSSAGLGFSTDADGVMAPGGAMPAPGEAQAPSPEKGETGGGDGTVSIPSVLGRTILRSGSVSLTVDSVADSFERVRQIADGSGGFVSDSSFYGSGDSQSASLTLRVPAGQFSQVVADLRALAIEVESVQTSSQEVTEEFTDLQATVRNLQAVEQQYLTLLSQAETIGDILQVQDRLSGVRLQIEQAQGRINMLDNLASLATLSVTLMPESVAVLSVSQDGFGDRVAAAWDSSLDTLAAIGTGIVVGLVWSWWLVPVVPVVWILWRRFGGRLLTPRRHVDTPEASA
jgi:hypothetical protein